MRSDQQRLSLSDKFPHSCHTLARDRPEQLSVPARRAACAPYAVNNLAIQGCPTQISASVGSRLRTKRTKGPGNCLNLDGSTAVDAPVPSIIILPGAFGLGLTHEMANECLNKFNPKKKNAEFASSD